MLDGEDIEAAVRTGVITRNVANQLRSLSAERRGAPAADEERFGLVGGYADVMTSAGLMLLLAPLTFLLWAVHPLAGLLLPALCWLLAEHFTIKRRLTLTGFLLFGWFTVGTAIGLYALALLTTSGGANVATLATDPTISLIVSGGTIVACAAWWMRMRLPIAFATASVAAANFLIHLLHLAWPQAPASAVGLVLLLTGSLLLGVALWWDMTDVRRETRRADIAFWLHAAAGFQLAGASYRLIFGVQGNPLGWERLYTFETLSPTAGSAATALIVFLGFVFLALAFDRRSLLISSLVFILPAAAKLSGMAGFPGMITAAMAIGAILLLMAGCWTSLRASVLRFLPVIVQAQLPRTQIVNYWPRPIA